MHDSYQMVATTLSLFAGEKEAEYVLMEAINHQLYTPAQLCCLSVDILINECMETPLQLWNHFKDDFATDHFIRTQSENIAINEISEDNWKSMGRTYKAMVCRIQ